MSDRHVVVFARAPYYGAVKSRLAGDVGCLEAWRFYRWNLLRLCQHLQTAGRFRIWLAVTPRSSLRLSGFWPEDVPRFAQTGVDLGERMINAMKTTKGNRVVLIGTDIPNVTNAYLEQAHRLLDAHDTVFGPVEDGGYWLIGCKRPQSLKKSDLQGVRWSTQFALSDCEERLNRCTTLNTPLVDIDDGEALQRFYQSNMAKWWSRRSTSSWS